jgi:hypothetical protein
MASSGIIRRVALVRTDVSEELSSSIIKVIRIGEPGTLAVTRNQRALRRNTEYCALNMCNVDYLSVVSYCCTTATGLKPNCSFIYTNSVALSPQANYSD